MILDAVAELDAVRDLAPGVPVTIQTLPDPVPGCRRRHKEAGAVVSGASNDLLELRYPVAGAHRYHCAPRRCSRARSSGPDGAVGPRRLIDLTQFDLTEFALQDVNNAITQAATHARQHLSGGGDAVQPTTLAACR